MAVRHPSGPGVPKLYDLWAWNNASGKTPNDCAFGGGIVPSSATLVGGDPGIGKSTLLLQVAARLARNGVKTVYVSGEEAAAQIQERAKRLKVAESPVQLATETDLRKILSALPEIELHCLRQRHRTIHGIVVGKCALKEGGG